MLGTKEKVVCEELEEEEAKCFSLLTKTDSKRFKIAKQSFVAKYAQKSNFFRVFCITKRYFLYWFCALLTLARINRNCRNHHSCKKNFFNSKSYLKNTFDIIRKIHESF